MSVNLWHGSAAICFVLAGLHHSDAVQTCTPNKRASNLSNRLAGNFNWLPHPVVAPESKLNFKLASFEER